MAKDTKKGKKPDELEDVEPGEDEDEEGMEKADLSTEDLDKAMDQLEDLAGTDPADRKTELLNKAATDELSKSEQEELFDLLGGDQKPEPRLADDVVRGFGESESLVKGIEVSEFLRENTDELVKSLERLADTVESQDKRQHGFNTALSKAIVTVGRLTAKLAAAVEAFGDQPARGPKSVRTPGQAKPLAKSFGADVEPEGGGEKLTKSMVLDSLEGMLHKSMAEGRSGQSRTNQDLALAIAQFETSGEITPSLLNEVRAHVAEATGQNPQGLH